MATQYTIRPNMRLEVVKNRQSFPFLIEPKANRRNFSSLMGRESITFQQPLSKEIEEHVDCLSQVNSSTLRKQKILEKTSEEKVGNNDAQQPVKNLEEEWRKLVTRNLHSNTDIKLGARILLFFSTCWSASRALLEQDTGHGNAGCDVTATSFRFVEGTRSSMRRTGRFFQFPVKNCWTISSHWTHHHLN